MKVVGDDMVSSQGYGRPELLVDVEWLAKHYLDPGLRIIDCDSLQAYRRAHIPSATALSVHPWLKDGDDFISSPPGSYLSSVPSHPHVIGRESFSELIRRLGVSNETTVVAYDGFNSSFATRLWWVLNYYGHENVRVLNGGWRKWMREGKPVTDEVLKPEAGNFTPQEIEEAVCRLDELKARFNEEELQIVNVLPQDVYRGLANPSRNQRLGHIPGSLNVPAQGLLGEDGTFKSLAELREVVERAGLSPQKETVVHCQAGILTTLGVFALHLLDWPRVRAYDGSMAEWANREDTPLATT